VVEMGQVPDAGELRLTLAPTQDVDLVELDDLTRSLRREVLELPVEVRSVKAPHAAPPGAKALDPVVVGTLLVALGGSGGLMGPVLDTVRSWLARHRGQRVVLELGGAKLELDGVSDAEREQLIAKFLEATQGSPA
jgi:hypothetical protein